MDIKTHIALRLRALRDPKSFSLATIAEMTIYEIDIYSQGWMSVRSTTRMPARNLMWLTTLPTAAKR